MFLAIGILGGLVFWPTPTEAALITIEIEAVVDRVDDPHGYLEGKIIVGDIITGAYTYDSSTPDQDWLWGSPSDIVGRYHHFAPPYGISLTVGDFVFQTDPSNVNFLIGIVNDNQSGDDIYGLLSYNNLPLSDGTLVGGISWTLEDSTGSVFSNDSLPTTAPVLDDWGFNRLTVNGGTPAIPFGILSHVTSAIPEPATILLFGLGTMLLRKRR